MPGKIVINPEVLQDKRDAMAVAWNEGLRLLMEDTKFKPAFEPTAEQRKFFSNTAYAEDDTALKRTIVARVATHDTSVSPTPEQEGETVRLLDLAMEMLGPQHQDTGTLQKMRDSVSAGKARGPVSPGLGEGDEAVEEPEGAESDEAAEVPEGAESAEAADLAGDVKEVDLLNNAMLNRSLTESEGRFLGGYLDSASKSKPGVLTVGEGLTYVTDEQGRRAPVTRAWLESHKDKAALEESLRTQQERFLLGVQKTLEPKLKQMDPATQALVANVAFNRGEKKAAEYADYILAAPPEKRHAEALSRLVIAGTPRGKAKGTIGLAEPRYKKLVEAFITPEKAAEYGKDWDDPDFRASVLEQSSVSTAAYVAKTHEKWGAKMRPGEQAKLYAVNARFK
jgi:hypothetical protein